MAGAKCCLVLTGYDLLFLFQDVHLQTLVRLAAVALGLLVQLQGLVQPVHVQAGLRAAVVALQQTMKNMAMLGTL